MANNDPAWVQRAQASIDAQVQAKRVAFNLASRKVIDGQNLATLPGNLDFLGHVCVRIDRDKPLSECVGVFLEQADCCPISCKIGHLCLDSAARRIVFRQTREVFAVDELIG